MNKITSIIITIFLSHLSSPSWSEILTLDDLVERNGFVYKKFSNTPYTGKVKSSYQGNENDRIGYKLNFSEGCFDISGEYKMEQ